MPQGWGPTGELSQLTSMPYQNPYQGRYEGVGQIPILGDNLLAQAVGQFFGGKAIEAAGMIPLGRGRENMYGRLRDRNLTQMHDEMMGDLAAEERPQITRALRGSAAMIGVPWQEPQRQAAGRVADVVSRGAAMIAGHTPDLLDSLGGNRGSSLALAEYAFRGGQHRLDPVTGETGMSGDSIKKLVNEVRTAMYDTDSSASMTRNVGFTMGEQGQVFADLQRRGMIAGGESNLQAITGDAEYPGRPQYSGESDAAYERGVLQQNDRVTGAIKRQYEAADVAVPTAEDGSIDLEAVQNDRSMLDRVMNDMDMQDVSQEFDSRKVISALENYGGAIKAMKEIFGDSGNPNAPMPELINALNALTGNAMAQLDPSKVEQMVRTTYALAEQTGVGLPGMMMMGQAAAAQAQALGINPLFGQVGVQGALGFRQTVQDQGLGGYSAWGRGDIEDFTKQEQALQLNAAGSAAANRMGAAYRIREALAGAGEETPFAADSNIEKWLSAVQAGEKFVTLDFDDGEGMREVGTQLTDSQFFDVIRTSTEQAGMPMSDATIAEFMGQKQQNQRLILKEGLTPIVRGLQPNEAREEAALVGQWAAGTRVDTLELGLGEGDHAQLVGGLSAAVAASLVDMDAEVATDEGALRRHFARQMKTRLETAAADPTHPMNAAANRLLTKFGGDEKGMDRWLAGTAESMKGAIDQAAKEEGFYGGIQDLMVMQNQDNIQDSDKNVFRAKAEGQITAAMAPFGAGGPLRSAMEAVISGPERGGTDLSDVLGSMVGGQRGKAMAKDMLPILQGLRDQQQELDKAMEEWESADDTNRAGRARKVEAKTAGLKKETEALARYLQGAGINLDAPVSKGEMASALKHQQWSAERLEDLRDGKVDMDEFTIDEGRQKEITQAAGDLGMSTDELLSMERSEFDKLMTDSNDISKAQAAVLTSTRDDIDTQTAESLDTENERAAEYAHRLLANTAAMRAGGTDLQTGVTDTLEAYEELQVLSAEAGGTLAASTGEETREEYAKIKERMTKGTNAMDAAGFRSGYGFMTDEQRESLATVTGKLSSVSDLVQGELDVMTMSREDMMSFTTAEPRVIKAAITESNRKRIADLQEKRHDFGTVVEDIQSQLVAEEVEGVDGNQDAIAEILGIGDERRDKIAAGEDTIKEHEIAGLTEEQVKELREVAGGDLTAKQDVALQDFTRGTTFLEDMGRKTGKTVNELLSTDEEELRRLATETTTDREPVITEADVDEMMVLQEGRGEADKGIRKTREDQSASADQIMGDSLEKFTGRSISDSAVVAEAEKAGLESWLKGIGASGDEAALQRSRLRERAETVDTLRGVRKKVKMGDDSFEEMLFKDGGKGEARSEAWFESRGVSEEGMEAVREAQGWKGRQKGWLQMEGDSGDGAAARELDMKSLLPESARKPELASDDGAGGKSGKSGYNFKIDRLVVNGEDMGRATASGEGERDGDANAAGTA